MDIRIKKSGLKIIHSKVPSSVQYHVSTTRLYIIVCTIIHTVHKISKPSCIFSNNRIFIFCSTLFPEIRSNDIFTVFCPNSFPEIIRDKFPEKHTSKENRILVRNFLKIIIILFQEFTFHTPLIYSRVYSDNQKTLEKEDDF